jgi:poly(3-hydroxybutyrate) depolymerase
MTTPRGTWSQTQVAGHSVDVFEPARPHPSGHAVIYLHGVHLNRLVDNAVFSGLFDRFGLRVAAPLAGPSWWTDRICPQFDPRLTAERHVLDNILPFVGLRWGTAPPRVGLLGTSMGGQGALRLAFRHPSTFPVSAAIAPAIDFHLKVAEGDPVLSAMYEDVEAARQDTALLHIHALNWPRHTWFCGDPTDVRWHDSADRLRMKLYSLGIPHECDLETSGGGHGFEYYNRMAASAIGFLAARLEQLSARTD